MKKLLLVMLVPVLVLGVMGCGAKTPDGSPSPISLQGLWVTTAVGAPDLVISGNQVTLLSKNPAYIGNIALRTSYNGDKGTDEDGILTDGQTIDLTFTWFDDPYKEVGSIKASYDSATPSFEVTEVKYSSYYQNVMLPPVATVYELQ